MDSLLNTLLIVAEVSGLRNTKSAFAQNKQRIKQILLIEQ